MKQPDDVVTTEPVTRDLNAPPTATALRVWLDTPNLLLSYERHGIVVVTVSVRREAAELAAVKFAEMLATYRAAGAGDPERLELLNELLSMTREVLGGSDGQVLPLGGDSASPLAALFGETS